MPAKTDFNVSPYWDDWTYQMPIFIESYFVPVSPYKQEN